MKNKNILNLGFFCLMISHANQHMCTTSFYLLKELEIKIHKVVVPIST
jgi:hypothetical protein